MSTIEQVAEYLTALSLRFRQPDADAIVIGFNGENTTYEATIRLRGSLVTVTAYTVAMVPRPRIAETIRVANLLNAHKVSFGCFWVDPDRTRIAFELTVAAPGGPTREQIGMAMAALSQIDDYFPIVASVIWGGRSAEAAMGIGSQDADDEPPTLDMAV
jgi:hypothetical protein